MKQEWKSRASSDARDFFVASAPGWDDPEQWQKQAQIDVQNIFSGFSEEELSDFDVLEIGCGVGRLVPSIASRIQSFTGFDIAEEMIAEARARCRTYPNARFFASTGASLPDKARDRFYHVAFCIGVFIHCPRDIIGSLIVDAFKQLAPGGELRFQVHADLNDPTGIDPQFNAEAIVENIAETEFSVPPEAHEFIEGCYFYGDRFSYNDATLYFSSLTDGELQLYRPTPLHILGKLVKPG
ncbi:MAG: class I SAM-dependent methyltransferase [Planctomycetota bacterium]